MGRRRARRRGGRALWVLTIAAVAAVSWLWWSEESPPPRAATTADRLRVHYLDVGQGDATVWELPGGGIVVYDCGPPVRTAAENPIVAYLRDEIGVPPSSILAALVASHGHLDHIGGCEELLAEYRFEHVYEAWYEGADAPASYVRFRDQLLGSGATIHRLPEIGPGTRLAVEGATFLWPRAFAPGGWDAIAEASLVVRLVHGGTSFCFQGDIGARQEAQLVSRCDVYLVGHHGSASASSAAWVARMAPEVAVVSFGENAYGHPNPKALCRVQAAGATVYATARVGTIVVESDGASVRVVRGAAESTDYCEPNASYWP